MNNRNAENLQKWRDERNLKPNTKVFIENILEELLEICYEDKIMIQNIKDDIMFDYFQGRELSENDTIDAICDIQIFSENEAELMGYNNAKAMEETIKEISSRNQCPLQKNMWSSWGYDNTKWKKDINQDEKTLFKANYEACKR